MNIKKRFYKQAEAVKHEDGFGVTLDGRFLKTPAGAVFLTASYDLALSSAEEWAAQGDEIHPHTMPLTQMVNTALDRVRPRRAEIIAALLRYIDTDLLFYRASAPVELVARQEEAWIPVIQWAEQYFAVSFQRTDGVMPIVQDPACHHAFNDWLSGLDDFALTAIHMASSVFGSLLLAVAFWLRFIKAKEAFLRARLDETYQAEQWGEDAEAKEREAHLQKEVETLDRFLSFWQKSSEE